MVWSRQYGFSGAEGRMSSANPVGFPGWQVDRAKKIMITPHKEWAVIEAEPDSVGGLYIRYAMIWALVPALAIFIRAIVFGYGIVGFTYRLAKIPALAIAVTQYVMALVSIAILALITDFIVTQFDGKANTLNAFRLSVYSATAAWLAGIFNLVPGMGLLTVLGLYSFYLFYTGLPRLMKVPQDKALVCTVVIALLAIILALIAGALLRPVSAHFGGPRPLDEIAADVSAGAITLPGVGTVNMGKIERNSRAEEDGQTPGVPVANNVNPADIKAMLPPVLAGYHLASSEASAIGAAGAGGARALGYYGQGDWTVTIELTKISAAEALEGVGSALDINEEREDSESGSFERTHIDYGQMVVEEWDPTAMTGRYTHLAKDGYVVTVKGQAASYDILRAMGDAVNVGNRQAIPGQ
jgi:hypothetical protein